MTFSGNRNLDLAIGLFLERGYYERHMEIEDDNNWHSLLIEQQPDVVVEGRCGVFRVPLADLVEESLGECDHAATSLRRFLRELSIDAWCNYPREIPVHNPFAPLHQIQCPRSNPDLWASTTVLGYADMPCDDPIFPHHSACFVATNQASFYMIDLAASQYGYDGGVMVQKWLPAEQAWTRLCEGAGYGMMGWPSTCEMFDTQWKKRAA